MTQKYFGTDGIRGKANTFPMTADIALKAAMATALVLRERRNGAQTDRVVIGKDTRLSCYMLEQALTAGFLSMGMEVILTGPIPTPGIAKLTGSLRADIGVMISASHNAFEDNGIKLFGPDGYKLGDEIESEIDVITAECAFGMPHMIQGRTNSEETPQTKNHLLRPAKQADPERSLKGRLCCSRSAGRRAGAAHRRTCLWLGTAR